MTKPFDKRTFLKSTILTIVLSCVGFALLEMHLVPYGFTLFCIMPIVIGYILGNTLSFTRSLFFGALVGILSYFYLLLIGGFESYFCIITVSPLLFILFICGIYFGNLLKKARDEKAPPENKKLNVTVLPLLVLMLSIGIEHFFTEKYTGVKVETSLFLPYPKEVVFDYIKSVDSLGGEVPFLLHIGVQKPLRCVLEKDTVGAKRICYFKEGTIDEVVTEYKRGESLKMKITRYGMPGRKWLHFEDAIYTFKEVKGGTEITRITTYKTELKPRFYWNYFETKAIETEHQYVLQDLKRRLDRDSSLIRHR
jgi:hypothetical protein